MPHVSKNSLPKEVIVIDDSPPTPSHTGGTKKRKRGGVGATYDPVYHQQETPANGRTNGCNVQLGQKRKEVDKQNGERQTAQKTTTFHLFGQHVSDACSNPQSRSSRLITYSKKQRCWGSQPPKGMLSVTFHGHMLTSMKLRYLTRRQRNSKPQSR